VSLGVVAVWHSLQSTGSPGEIPGHLQQPMNRGSGKQLCRICEQNLQRLSVVVEPDSGILGLQAGEDVNAIHSWQDDFAEVLHLPHHGFEIIGWDLELDVPAEGPLFYLRSRPLNSHKNLNFVIWLDPQQIERYG